MRYDRLITLAMLGTIAVGIPACASESEPDPAARADQGPPPTESELRKANVFVRHLGDPRLMQSPYDTLHGPIDLPTLTNINTGQPIQHTDWDGFLDSAKANTHARVTLWDEQNYRGKSVTLQPGEESGNLNTDHGFTDGAGSMKIEFQRPE